MSMVSSRDPEFARNTARPFVSGKNWSEDWQNDAGKGFVSAREDLRPLLDS
jgi:hypothetical protein